MNRFFQKLRHIFRRKPPEPFICGTLLMRLTPEQRERFWAVREGEKTSKSAPKSSK